MVPGTGNIPLEIATKYSMVKSGHKWLTQYRKEQILQIHQGRRKLPDNPHSQFSHDMAIKL